MIEKDWKYHCEVVRDIEYDLVADDQGRTVDLGWDKTGLTVHEWITVLNKVAYEIYKSGHRADKLVMNKDTFDILCFICNEFYDSIDKKMNHYTVEVSDCAGHTVFMYSKDELQGKINITDYDKSL